MITKHIFKLLYILSSNCREESFPTLVKRDDKTLDKNPYGENSSVQGLQPCESSIFNPTKFIMKTYAAIITDVPNGYTYKTAVVTTAQRAKKLAHDFVIRKNIDYADIEVVTLDIL